MLKFLENYEFITSWILLPVEIVFLGLMLWEFKYIRKEQQEKRKKDIEKKIKYFVWCIVNDFTNLYKQKLDTGENNEYFRKIIYMDTKTIEVICEQLSKKNNGLLSFIFYKKIITNSIKNLVKQFNIGELINYEDLYDYFLGLKNDIFILDILLPSFIKERKKYFKSDKEIDEIYEKLTSSL